MNPLHQLFMLLALDPNLLPPTLYCKGSVFTDGTSIRANLVIKPISQLQHAPPPKYPQLPEPTQQAPAITHHASSLIPHDSSLTPSADRARRLQDLRQWWSALPTDQDRARAAGRLLGLED